MTRPRAGSTARSAPDATPQATPAIGARLLFKAQEACEVLGGIHPHTLTRLEARGLIRSVKLLRHKLYAAKDVEALVEGLRKW